MCKISALIVTYNYGKFIRESLESVLTQDCDESIEIIVVDDGSTDDTREILKSYPQVKYIYQDHQGVSVARNRAMEEAKGEYLAFLDADDIWIKDKIRLQFEYMKENPNCKIVFTRYENFLENPELRGAEWVKKCILFSMKDKRYLTASLFKKELMKEIGGFSVELERGEDTEWVTRVMLKGIETGLIDKILYRRRLHGNNLTKGNEQDTSDDIQKMRANILQRNLRTIGNRMNFTNSGISVVIPVMNGEKHIKEAIDSVLEQQKDLENISVEIIVADDGSTDNTVQIAKECGVTVYELPHRGAAAAKNSGLMKAKHEYVMFLDADDKLAKGALKALYETLTKEPELACVFSYAKDFYEDDKNRAGRIYSGCLPGCALLKKSVFKKVGLFNDTLQTGETVEWIARFRDSGLPEKMIQVVTLERRIHDSNTGKTMKEQEQKDYARILRERLRRKQ